MPAKKTYYEILGIPRNATTEQIKRRYRQLARKYHPDVASDKAAAQAAFIEISEAYQTLINPDKRTIYDASMDAEIFHVEARRPTSSGANYRPASSAGTGARARQEPRRKPAAEAQRLVEEGYAAFRQGDLSAAARLCRNARQLDKRNLRAHIILGDVYRIQGQTDAAIAMYTIAAQLDPHNNDILGRLHRMVRHASKASSDPVFHERRSALKIGLSMMGWSVCAFMFAMLWFGPGEPIPWLRINLPMVSTWSTFLVTTLLTTGAVTGFMLAVSESIDPMDEELIFQGVRTLGARRSVYPIGLLLIMFNFFNFYLTVIMYTILGSVQDRLSVSVYKTFGATLILVLIAAMVYAPGRDQVLIHGGNVAFLGLLVGWTIGDMFRPGW